MEKQKILRGLPRIDSLVKDAEQGCDLPYYILLEGCRGALDMLRTEVLEGKRTEIPALSDIVAIAQAKAKNEMTLSLVPVINATGVVIHTNLGRSVLSESAAENVKKIAMSYSTLEYDISSGGRGSRHSHLEPLLCALTGGEAAMVVNNNAAAVLLALCALCKGEVIVSRGELVEIGGSFRVPDIMALGGAKLREVGTTNKTRIADYAAAINEQTAALLKVSTSNFKIVGFSEEASLSELVDLGTQHNLPVIYDLGAGLMSDDLGCGLACGEEGKSKGASSDDIAGKHGVVSCGIFRCISDESGDLISRNNSEISCKNSSFSFDEPTVPECIKSGADVVCFSGDKLFGGAQAGIIVGKKKLVDAMKKHQLARALRIDKLSLAALEATLLEYKSPDFARKIPTLACITASETELKTKANTLCQMIVAALDGESACSKNAAACTENNADDANSNTINNGICTDCSAESGKKHDGRNTLGGKARLVVGVKRAEAQVGGGSAPGEVLSSYVVEIRSESLSENEIESLLRGYETPIITRINRGGVLIDVRTVAESDYSVIAKALVHVAAQGNHESCRDKSIKNCEEIKRTKNDKRGGTSGENKKATDSKSDKRNNKVIASGGRKGDNGNAAKAGEKGKERHK